MESMILAVSLMCAMGVPSPALAAEQARAVETREAYVKKAHAAVDALGAKIDALEAKAAKAGGEARENADDRLRALKVRRKSLKKDLVRLKRAGDKAWTKVKAGVDRGIADLEKAYDEAAGDRR
ncbi:MAG: hypothetical protein Q8T11_13395 [Elusimicrobiota bacterium]|nr:hypothetical protein [Elusimicrobiota bacterium]